MTVTDKNSYFYCIERWYLKRSSLNNKSYLLFHWCKGGISNLVFYPYNKCEVCTKPVPNIVKMKYKLLQANI